MKERLSGTLTKRLNGKERNLQSTVKEKRSSCSKPAKEIIDIDKEIFEEIEKVTFKFAHKEMTVGEAGLVFVYEVGRELDRLYVIAISENCGTILFYLPEDLKLKIMDRVSPLPISLDNYLFNLIDYNPKTFEFAYTMAKLGCTVEEADNALMKLSENMKIEKLAPADIETKSNNWLKLHGYPMRRKKGKRK